jgi:hypothetical protein
MRFFCFSLLNIQIALTRASFTHDFNKFLKTTYGGEVQRALERRDLNDFGSFGGKSHYNESLVKRAVIFVHGLTMNAFGFEDIQRYFFQKGYKNAELYATTWGDGNTPISNVFDSDMECENVKQASFILFFHQTSSTNTTNIYELEV